MNLLYLNRAQIALSLFSYTLQSTIQSSFSRWVLSFQGEKELSSYLDNSMLLPLSLPVLLLLLPLVFSTFTLIRESCQWTPLGWIQFPFQSVIFRTLSGKSFWKRNIDEMVTEYLKRSISGSKYEFSTSPLIPRCWFLWSVISKWCYFWELGQAFPKLFGITKSIIIVSDRINALSRRSASLEHEIWNKHLSSNKRPSSIKRPPHHPKNSKNLKAGLL